MNNIEFYLNNNEVINWLKEIGFSNSSAIKRKIRSKNSNDYLNLLGVIDELRIGAFLSKFSNIKYDFNINGKTPDWFSLNTNSIIEVKGVNQIRKDLIRDKFEDTLKENIRKVKGTFFVSIRYNGDENTSFFTCFDHDNFILNFSNWFSKNTTIGSVFNKNGVKISLLQKDKNLKNLDVGIGNFNNINTDSRKIKNIIDEKLEIYKEVITKQKAEFIIAIVSDIKNGLRKIDLQTLLYGSTVDNQILKTQYSNINGLYYNSKYRKHISGVIFMIRGQKPFFFKNYSHNKIELSNKIEQYLA